MVSWYMFMCVKSRTPSNYKIRHAEALVQEIIRENIQCIAEMAKKLESCGTIEREDIDDWFSDLII